jgi:hypothetical protein
MTTHKQGRGKFKPHAEVIKFPGVDFRRRNGSKVVIDHNVIPKVGDLVKYESPIIPFDHDDSGIADNNLKIEDYGNEML